MTDTNNTQVAPTAAEATADSGDVAGGWGGGTDIGWCGVGGGQMGESGVDGEGVAVLGVGQRWPGYTFVSERSY